MLQERIEPAWIDAFEAVLTRCALQPQDTVAILGETQSRPVLIELARLAASRLGARPFVLTLPSMFNTINEPITHSTNTNPTIQQLNPIITTLQTNTLVINYTIKNLIHTPKLPTILQNNDHTQFFGERAERFRGRSGNGLSQIESLYRFGLTEIKRVMQFLENDELSSFGSNLADSVLQFRYVSSAVSRTRLLNQTYFQKIFHFYTIIRLNE